MSINPFLAWAVIATLASVQEARAHTRPAAPTAPGAATNASAPAIAEQANRLLKEMGAYIGSANEFTFHADVTFDHVLARSCNTPRSRKSC